MKVVHLKPQSSFRTELRSDTLWGLLMVAIKNVYSENFLEECLEQFNSGKPPFFISSAFYYAHNNVQDNREKTYYFPKPLFKTFELAEETSANAKSYRKHLEKLKNFKKKNQVDLNTFESIINGEKSELDLYNEFNPETEILQGQYSKKEIITKKASLDRLTTSTREENGRGQLFSMNEIYLEDGGLFFLVDGDTSILEPALRFLHHYGFGADSSNGKGHFSLTDPIFQEFTIRQPEDKKHWVNLGVYSPDLTEIEHYKNNQGDVFYSLEQRTGKVGVTFFETGDVFKDSVVCFGEGSVFPVINGKKHYGRVNKVKEFGIKNIYQFGIAFRINANIRET